MSFNMGWLTEFAKIVPVIAPQVLNGAAVDSLYTDLSKYTRLTYLLAIGNRAGSTTPDVTINQATDDAGTGAKALNFDTYFTGAYSQTADSLASGATDGDSFAITATDNTQYLINIQAKQLDKNNGFRCTSLNLATPGANDVPLCCFAILYDGMFSGKESTLPSVVAPSDL